MSHPVIIVGAGPIGLLLAGELALAGLRPLVLDRLADPDPHAPGMAINSATVELLDQRGLLDALREGTMELPLSHFSNIWLDQSSLFGPHSHSRVVPQSRLEQRLAQWTWELGVTVRRGAEVVGLRQDEESVTLDLRTAEGEEQLTAQYVVGADGVDSTVRRLAGIGFPGTDHPFYGIIGDVRIAAADFQPEQHFGAKYSPVGGLFTATPIGPDLWRIVTSEFGVEPARGRSDEVTLAELNARVLRLTGTEFRNARPLWLSRTDNPSRLADRYRAGRVFVAGDAAHVFFALNGQRLSSGFQDAVNLGWKLAAALHGWAPAGLLDSYEAERLPAGRFAVENVEAQLALAAPPESAAPLRALLGRLLKFEPVNRFLAETAQGLGVRYLPETPADGDDAAPHALLGLRLPPVRLRTADGETGLPSLLHAGRGVLLDLSGGKAGRPDLAGWADRVDVVVAEPSAEIGLVAALLRPDGHVAWLTDDETEFTGLRETLTAWFGRPTGTEPTGTDPTTAEL
jgi:2-polyprenyl-6-methoxyphenol hydroxylase-like FAD-dependent oxidoreductase